MGAGEDFGGRTGQASEPWDEIPAGERLRVDLDGYEGPLDVLLDLARTQKLDITKISILQLADQYLAFIHELHQLRLEIAADYLVMGAWLAYLKSRLLLPETEDEDEPTGPEMAAALAFQLRRLEAMRAAGQDILARPRLGRDFFARGAPEGFVVVSTSVYDVTLYDLLKAYGGQRARLAGASLAIEVSTLYSVDAAIARLKDLLGEMPDWQLLASFLPPEPEDDLRARSATAAMFAASLELTRAGAAQLRQDRAFGPIYVRARKRDKSGDRGKSRP